MTLGSIRRFRSGALKLRSQGGWKNLTRSAATAAAPVHAVAASVTIDPTGADNSIAYTADTAGASGNGITVTYVISGTGSTATVSVTNNDITVTAGSACTAQSVITAVNAHAGASALVTAAASGTVTGTIAAVTTTALSGGTDATTAGAGDTRVDSGFLYVAYADVTASSTSGWKRIALSALA